MSGNTFGKLFRLTSFGESHGPALGGILDGCPPGILLHEDLLQKSLDTRRPGQAGLAVTARNEPDKIRLLSGVFSGYTTGTSIGFLIENTDQRSHDYGPLQDTFRPGHGDFSYQAKYGLRDYRGGGRSSGRETAIRVAGGAIAQNFLEAQHIFVQAATIELGGISAENPAVLDFAGSENRAFFAAKDSLITPWEDRIRAVRAAGDTVGGVVALRTQGVPAGLGEPVFDKLDARLAAALMSVGAVKGVEIGAGFSAARLLGSENNDTLTSEGFLSNNAGGVLAGLSSGQEIDLRVAVKPIPSVALPQKTINTRGQDIDLQISGRHDICAIPRIVPVLKAMVMLVLADMLLLQRRLQS